MEPLARLLREVMDAQGLRVTDVAAATELDRRHVSQLVNRAAPYTDGPSVETMQALARIPGLSLADIARAVNESTGRPLPSAPEEEAEAESPMRRSVRAVLAKIPEDELPRALQILSALLP